MDMRQKCSKGIFEKSPLIPLNPLKMTKEWFFFSNFLQISTSEFSGIWHLRRTWIGDKNFPSGLKENS